MKPSNWKQEEIEYLKEKMGVLSFKTIAKNLGRTETACIVKSKRLKLHSFKHNTDLITVSDAAEMLNIDRNTVYYLVEAGRLKPRYKNIRYKSKQLFLNYDEVCDFATIYQKQNNKKWTEYEISRLYCLFKMGKTYSEIGKELNRTESAISHKIRRLIKRKVD